MAYWRRKVVYAKRLSILANFNPLPELPLCMVPKIQTQKGFGGGGMGKPW